MWYQYTKRKVFFMKKFNAKNLVLSLSFLLLFIVWTCSVKLIDVQKIGPLDSEVGFAVLNEFVHNLIGENLSLYILTDWLSIVPILFVFVFALIGLIQLIKRKSLLKVDYDILVLGGFYIAVFALYALFEVVVINYRPLLIEGILEASYPSSTTMLVLCVMPTAIMQLNSRIKNKALKMSVISVLTAFIAFMVVARLLSGVHWLSDILGGVLLSVGLVFGYRFFAEMKEEPIE